jgi:hypothetical protein
MSSNVRGLLDYQTVHGWNAAGLDILWGRQGFDDDLTTIVDVPECCGPP